MSDYEPDVIEAIHDIAAKALLFDQAEDKA